MDRRASWAIVHGFTKSRTALSTSLPLSINLAGESEKKCWENGWVSSFPHSISFPPGLAHDFRFLTWAPATSASLLKLCLCLDASWCHCHGSWAICGPGWCADDHCKSAPRNSPGHKNESEIKCCFYHYLLLSLTKHQVWDSIWLLWWFKYMQWTLEQHGFEMYRFTYLWVLFFSKYVQQYYMIESEDTEAWIQRVNCKAISWSLTTQGSVLHPSHCWRVHANDFLVSWELTSRELTKELTFSPIWVICHCLACWFFFWYYQNLLSVILAVLPVTWCGRLKNCPLRRSPWPYLWNLWMLTDCDQKNAVKLEILKWVGYLELYG